MQLAVPAGQGAMAAVLSLDAAQVAKACAEAAKETGQPVAAANLNSPGQTVISGAAGAVERAVELCKQAGVKRAVMLPVSAPFHCALMQPAQDRLASDLEKLEFRDPKYPIAANVSAALVASGDAARRALIAQVTGAVRWVECIELLVREGATQFVEVGPGRVLSGLMKQILGKDSTLPVMNVEDAASLEKTLAGLSAAG